ncbi:MAG: hypothetical protein ABIT20_01505 [Gemmatimonadaceae bacterium]
MSRLYPAILALSLPAIAGAQAPIPIRKVGPILATSIENVGRAVTVRATASGHVIVGAGSRQRVYAFDSTLKNFTLVADSGSGTGSGLSRPIGLIPFLGDSTLLPDLVANALLVLDGTGKQVRSMAPPRTQDLQFLVSPVTSGRPVLDPKGRLIYKGALGKAQPPKMTPPGKTIELSPTNPDSAPIVRGDFDTRRIDTLAWMKTPNQGRVGQQLIPNPGGGPPSMTVHLQVNPFAVADEWSLLNDGTIAIVRVHDYHIDWIDPDGTTRSSPKMPIDWRKYTDAERLQVADSLRRFVEESSKRNLAARPAGNAPIKMEVSVVPDSEFPTFWPPVMAGSVLSDLDGHVWILPATSTNAANGLTYDVVNRKGEIIERVQLPQGCVLVGFGPRKMVYMTKAVGNNTYLTRALLDARR